jgi:hypothetical protein
VLITICRFRDPGIIHRNANIFAILSWVLIAITGICGIAILSCGTTGTYCTHTGRDEPPDYALAGLLLLAGGLVCGGGGPGDNRLKAGFWLRIPYAIKTLLMSRFQDQAFCIRNGPFFSTCTMQLPGGLTPVLTSWSRSGLISAEAYQWYLQNCLFPVLK